MNIILRASMSDTDGTYVLEYDSGTGTANQVVNYVAYRQCRNQLNNTRNKGRESYFRSLSLYEIDLG